MLKFSIIKMKAGKTDNLLQSSVSDILSTLAVELFIKLVETRLLISLSNSGIVCAMKDVVVVMTDFWFAFKKSLKI